MVPTWDLEVVLNYLMSARFEPPESVSLLLWTVKTLDMSPPCLSIHRRSASLRTNITFLPKVANVDYINREICLEALPTQGKGKVSKRLSLLCPVRALQVYLDKSKGTRRPGVNQLFVSCKQGHTGYPVTKQCIAKWLTKVIKDAYTVVGMEPPL